MPTQLIWPGDIPVVRIWILRLDLPVAGLVKPEELVSVEEHSRARFLKSDKHRQRFIFSAAARRLVLGRALGMRPTDVTIVYGKNGNPMLPDRDEYLSFADSNDLALVALSSGTRVGVDLEAIPDSSTCEDIASLYAPAEQAWLRSSPSHLRPERFTRLWCRKEAVGKLHGHGLEATLNKTALSTSARNFADGGWTVHDFRPANGYLACVATAAAPATIRIERLDTWEALWRGNTGLPLERKCQGEIDALVC